MKKPRRMYTKVHYKCTRVKTIKTKVMEGISAIMSGVILTTLTFATTEVTLSRYDASIAEAETTEVNEAKDFELSKLYAGVQYDIIEDMFGDEDQASDVANLAMDYTDAFYNVMLRRGKEQEEEDDNVVLVTNTVDTSTSTITTDEEKIEEVRSDDSSNVNENIDESSTNNGDSDPINKVNTIVSTKEADPVSLTAVDELYPDETVYTTQNVIIRMNATKESKKVGTLSKYESLTKVGELGEWSKVEYNDGYAFVKTEYLTEYAPATLTAEDEAYPDETVYMTHTVNIRYAPDKESEKLGSLNEYDSITKVGEEGEWSKVQYGDGYAYIHSEYLTTKAPSYTDYDAPKNSKKSWMPQGAITNRSSAQYKMMHNDAHVGNYGIMMVGDRYCVALGSYYTTTIGTKFDLILTDGTVIKCILGDGKADKDTNSSNQITSANGCMSEFIIGSTDDCSTYYLDSRAKRSGDISSIPEFSASIKTVRVYK